MKDLVKNEIYEAEISGYSSSGSGVARIEGRAVFVPRTIVGEVWRIVIVKVSASAVYGRALEPVKLSPREGLRSVKTAFAAVAAASGT